MESRHHRAPVVEQADTSSPTDASLFADALLGKPVSRTSRAADDARTQHDCLRWLAEISSRHERQLLRPLRDAAEATAQREHSDWLAAISTVHEADWDPAKHPRRGTAPNAGWFASLADRLERKNLSHLRTRLPLVIGMWVN